MSKTKLDCEQAVCLSQELFHAHFSGEPEKWFSYHSPDSIYLGTGEPALFGRDAIRARFKDFSGILLDILTEEYHPVPLDSSSALVCGQILVQNQRKTFCVITRFTLVYRNAGGRLQLSHIHNSYEYVPAGETPSLKLDLNTLKFVRSLILKQHSGKRIAVRSGNQTIFVDPYTVLYVQSQNKRTELVCADQVISCNSSLSDLARELPDIFYPLHRGYYVNTLYITAIRRFEAELISGAVLPIPALNYTKIRDDLLDRIQIKP